MREKLIIANTHLREAFTMARANRMERGLANRLRDAIVATEDSITTLDVLKAGKHYAN